MARFAQLWLGFFDRVCQQPSRTRGPSQKLMPFWPHLRLLTTSQCYAGIKMVMHIWCYIHILLPLVESVLSFFVNVVVYRILM